MGKKVKEDTIAAISGTNEIEDGDQREEIYEQKRSEIQYKFR